MREPHSYVQELQDQLVTMAMASSEGGVLERPGGVFIRRADLLSADDVALLRTTARIHVLCDGVGLGEIVAANILSHAERVSEEAFGARRSRRSKSRPSESSRRPSPPCIRTGTARARTANDFAIDVAGARVPPAPWANVIANPSVGFCVTERGGGFTWAENSHFFRLTPWFNDPVSDPCGEVLYLQDVDSGFVWNPTPGPSAAVGDPTRSPAVFGHARAWRHTLRARARGHRDRVDARRAAHRRGQDLLIADHESKRDDSPTLA